MSRYVLTQGSVHGRFWHRLLDGTARHVEVGGRSAAISCARSLLLRPGSRVTLVLNSVPGDENAVPGDEGGEAAEDERSTILGLLRQVADDHRFDLLLLPKSEVVIELGSGSGKRRPILEPRIEPLVAA